MWRQGDQTSAQADDPVFVDNMYRFFRDNAASIGYETYFDANPANGDHALCPGAQFPKLDRHLQGRLERARVAARASPSRPTRAVAG